MLLAGPNVQCVSFAVVIKKKCMHTACVFQPVCLSIQITFTDCISLRHNSIDNRGGDGKEDIIKMYPPKVCVDTEYNWLLSGNLVVSKPQI